MYGMHGRILHIDLTESSISEEQVPEEYIRQYIGGKGLGLKLLLDKSPDSDFDPLSGENPVIFMTGPFTGLGVPGSGRHVVLSKSPLTGYLVESYSGGYFGNALKLSGFDGIIITGKAETPKFLVIKSDEQFIEDSGKLGLWGKYPAEVVKIINKEYGNLKVSSIGPAGEKLVKFSSLINDKNRANGRCGFGAILGSKNLKAVCAGGEVKPKVFDEDGFKAARKKYLESLRADPGMQNFGELGTPNLVMSLNEMQILPTRNFKFGQFKNAEAISAHALKDSLLAGRGTCSYCPVRCKREVEGEYRGEKISRDYGGPEYETLAAFGSMACNDNLESICLANQKCNQYGLDTISTGNVIACAIEASERGLIEEKLSWNDPEVILDLIEQINQREGLGNILAEGVKYFSEKIGGEGFAMHVKGLEMPMHEARGKKGLGLSYALSPRGCSHLDGLQDTLIMKPNSAPELGAVEPFSRFSLANKVQVVINIENTRSFTNSLIQCVFTVKYVGQFYNVDQMRDIYNSITGEKMDVDSMLSKGAAIYDLGREFSYRMGLRRKDDDLPQRFKTETLEFPEGRYSIPDEELEKYMDEYLALRGWNKSGRPERFNQIK
jgi:aldehyde:ferredoxin oxidoreductase